jgi:hypothetical protein
MTEPIQPKPLSPALDLLTPGALAGEKLSAPAISPEPFWRVAFGRVPRPDLMFRLNHVFVVMAFSDDMREVFEAIKDECSKLGFVANRVDETTGSVLVIKEIVDAIEQAEFIVCDVTHARPNVYYELGYAHGVGNQGSNILLIAREGTELHFDIKSLKVAFYKSIEDLRPAVLSFALDVMKRRPEQLFVPVALKPAEAGS